MLESLLVYLTALYAMVMSFKKNCQPHKKYFEFQRSIIQSLNLLGKTSKVERKIATPGQGTSTKYQKVIYSASDSIKVGLSPSKKICVICLIESPVKMIKNAFYFILKALFVLKIFKFLSRLFGHLGKTA